MMRQLVAAFGRGWAPTSREVEWTVVVTDRYTGLRRELRVFAPGDEPDTAGFLAHAEMTEDESVESLQS